MTTSICSSLCMTFDALFKKIIYIQLMFFYLHHFHSEPTFVLLWTVQRNSLALHLVELISLPDKYNEYYYIDASVLSRFEH